MYSILPTINRDFILSKVSQEQIMERYTGVPIRINEKFHSPFREDNSPSAVYYYNKKTREATWTLPDGAVQADEISAPGEKPSV